jgi:hypothetical protein
MFIFKKIKIVYNYFINRYLQNNKLNWLVGYIDVIAASQHFRSLFICREKSILHATTWSTIKNRQPFTATGCKTIKHRKFY